MQAVRYIGGKSQAGGGLNGGTTDVCHLIVSQIFCYARSKKTSCAILFVDIIDAFGSIARHIAIPELPRQNKLGDDAWRPAASTARMQMAW